MGSHIIDLHQADKTKLDLVGGKAANLGELFRIEGIEVPPGFCITTAAYQEIIGNNALLPSLLDQLDRVRMHDRNGIREISAKIREAIESIPIAENIATEVSDYLVRYGEEDAWAVRSSATAEDLPAASFTGQQDSYLNITGKNEMLKHISKCWASLFTERAVTYRLKNGYGHRTIRLAVIVQKMVFPQVSGILFTADPVSANRKILSIDASFGLGEALVSGLVNADNFKVQNGKITGKKISPKKLAVYALQDGGTGKQEIDTAQQNRQALTDGQVLHLEQIGRKIEAHFGDPQDIEWCLADGVFYIVQSRPVTTLYPIPQANDGENHVYLSVGHQQMMTDAMKPLGLSFFRLMTRADMRQAGGRLFVDVAPMLASPAGRETMINTLGKFDPLVKDALTTIVERGDFIKMLPDEQQETASGKSKPPPLDYKTLKDYDGAIVDSLIARSEASLKKLKEDIKNKSGTHLLDFILKDIEEYKKRSLDPETFGVIMTGMNAASWLNDKMKEWLGEQNVSDFLSQSVPNNITAEMGLALLEVADLVRPHRKIIEFLEQVKDDDFLNELPAFEGGQETRDAIMAFLQKFGMRCAGEIDITRTRWSEKPSTLVPMILTNIKNQKPGAASRKFDQGLQQALKKEEELLNRLEQLPGGEEKAEETKRMIGLVRNLSGYREYPKYSIVKRYFVYKRALLKEADRLVQAKLIREKEDIYYLYLEELRDAVDKQYLDPELIRQRKEEYNLYKNLTPPRVMTSDGEIISGRYKRENMPAGAIAGLAVSSGMVEGRARVILNMEEADLEEGDILVTRFTDPSWTPLFVSIKGLVTEVGGLMTHGAVIAREYGLPAVVGVDNATRLIKDGQRIRVHGTEGFVEILK